MLAKVMSCAIVGLEAQIVEVEVDLTRGQPFFTLVGLHDAAVRESLDRVHAAIKNSGHILPANKCVAVNLAPADLRKAGPACDPSNPFPSTWPLPLLYYAEQPDVEQQRKLHRAARRSMRQPTKGQQKQTISLGLPGVILGA